MDPIFVGLTASLVQLIQAMAKAISLVNEIKNAPKERADLAQELVGMLGGLTSLRYRVEECKQNPPLVCRCWGFGGPKRSCAAVAGNCCYPLRPDVQGGRGEECCPLALPEE